MNVINELITGTSSDDCIHLLDEWIKPIKKMNYDKHIKSPKNTPIVLEQFINNMIDLYDNICIIFREEDINIRDEKLKKIGWPDKLIECSKNIIVRTNIKDRLKLWCKTFTLDSKFLTVLKQNNEISTEDI
jgi:hypothetical protein